MFTRKDYMDGKCSHRDYYGQFVTDTTRSVVARCIGVDRIRQSRDEHLNDIPLARWDALPKVCAAGRMKEAGDWLSPAGWVCIAKEAARQLAAGATR